MLNLAISGARIRLFTHPKSEVPMPHYEFFCHACKKIFSRILTIADHDKEEKTSCPHCGSKNVEQRWSAFSAVTSRKSA
jgi:putative FmdB family regulatory protein